MKLLVWASDRRTGLIAARGIRRMVDRRGLLTPAARQWLQAAKRRTP